MNIKQYTVFILLFIATCCFFSSCEKKCCEVFQREGISFKLPNYWKIDEIDSTESNFFFMSLSKEGHGASADAFIEWNHGKIPLDTVCNFAIETYMSEPAFLAGDIKFAKPVYEEYGGHKALCANFDVNLLGIKNVGKVHCFYLESCDRTVMIAYLQNADVAAKQKADYDIIENSFGCKKQKK